MSKRREIVFNEKEVAIFQRMCTIAYLYNVPKELIIESLISEHSGHKAFSYVVTEIEHSRLVRWMRVVWAYKPEEEFKTLIKDVMQLRITLPETKVKKGNFLCSHCDNTGCGAFPNGEFTKCEDFEELVTE